MTLSQALKAPAELLRVAVHGADTPQGHELASLLRLHPGVGSAEEVACDGSTLIGWDATAEPCWADTPARPQGGVDVAFVCLPPELALRVRAQARRAGAQVIELPPEPEQPELDPLAESEDVVTASDEAISAGLGFGPTVLAQPEPELDMSVAIGLSRLATGVAVEAAAGEPRAVRSAGQALRAMNRMSGLEETLGLPERGVAAQPGKPTESGDPC